VAWNAVDNCDTLICVGTSLEVEPAASLPWRALNTGALVIEINPLPTALSSQAHAYLDGSAAQILPELVRQQIAVQG
jgi:NAD-dependent deacetylase